MGSKEIDWCELGLLKIDTAERQKEANTRRLNVRKQKKPFEDSSLEAKGWRRGKELSRSQVWEIDKSHDEALEDAAWLIFHKLGLDFISKGRDFNLQFSSTESDTKQIDVFGVDEKAKLIFICECKSRSSLGKLSLKKEIGESADILEKYSKFLPSIGGRDYRVISLYITRNVVWADRDEERAKSRRINILKDDNLRYFENLINTLGKGATSQVYGYLIPDGKITNLETLEVTAFRYFFKLDGKKVPFYSFMMPAGELVKISFVSHKGLNDHGDTSYQRMIKKPRIKKIQKFAVNHGLFATNVLVNLISKPVVNRLGKGIEAVTLKLPSKYRSAIIIDGQHRLFGCASSSETENKELLVTAFENLSRKQEFDLFATINNEQQKISPNLMAALKAGYIEDETPEKTLDAIASQVFQNLAGDTKSPFYNRFRPTDESPAEKTQNLTLNTLQKELVASKLIGAVSATTGRLDSGPFSGKNHHDTILKTEKVLRGYFALIRSANSAAWDDPKVNICINPAIQAHVQLIKTILEYHGNSKIPKSPKKIVEILSNATGELTKLLSTLSKADLANKFEKGYGMRAVSGIYSELLDEAKRTIPSLSS